MTPLSNSLWAIETFVILVFWRRNAWRPFWNQNLGKLQGFCLVYIYLISSKWSITQQNTKTLTQNCLLPPPWSDFIGEFFHWPFEISERKSLAQINATLHAVMRVFYWISRQFYLLNEFLSTSEIFIISFPGFVRTAPSPNDNTRFLGFSNSSKVGSCYTSTHMISDSQSIGVRLRITRIMKLIDILDHFNASTHVKQVVSPHFWLTVKMFWDYFALAFKMRNFKVNRTLQSDEKDFDAHRIHCS